MSSGKKVRAEDVEAEWDRSYLTQTMLEHPYPIVKILQYLCEKDD